MADGAFQKKAHQDIGDLSPVEQIVQANRAYYDAWRSMWAQASPETDLASLTEEPSKSMDVDSFTIGDAQSDQHS